MTKIKVFFATNRNMITDRHGSVKYQGSSEPSYRFGIHPSDFRVGTANVRILKGEAETPAHYMDAEIFPESYENGKFVVKGSDMLFPKFLEDLNGQSNSAKSALVFIPGFNYSFEQSIERAALLSHIYSTEDRQLVPFVFSWPSDGKLRFSYDDDLRDARLSGEAAGRAFRAFVRLMAKMRKKDECNECISSAFLVAHSMGAYALRFAVKELQKYPHEMIPVFNSVIIAGADEEQDCFLDREKMPNLFKLTGDVIIYVNKADKALRHAENQPSLGHHGPCSETIRTFKGRLSVIRCHQVDYPYKDASRHQYYRESSEVIDDIKLVIEGVEVDEFNNRKLIEDGVYRLERYD